MTNEGSRLALLGFAIFALVFLYAFFMLGSVSVMRSRSWRLRKPNFAQKIGAKVARKILKDTDTYILICRVGMYLSALLSGAVIILISQSDKFWHVLMVAHGGFASYGPYVTPLMILATATVTLVAVQLVKAIGYAAPDLVLCYMAFPLLVIGKMFRPMIASVNWLARVFLKGLGLKPPAERELAVYAEDISEIVEKSSEAGKIDEEEREMIQGVFDFSDTLVREVMTPRNDIIAVTESASLEAVVEIFENQGFSRILVIGKSLDDVRGVVMAKDLIPYISVRKEQFDLRTVMRDPLTVSGSKNIDELLQEFRRSGVHFAVVLDEHGGVDGVITMEDLLEEIVGEIFDEYDRPDEEQSFEETHSGDLLVDGSTHIDDLNQMYGFTIPSGEYDTIAGFVTQLLGRLPEEGEVVTHDGIELRVEEIVQNRIVQVRIINSADNEDPNAAPAQSSAGGIK